MWAQEYQLNQQHYQIDPAQFEEYEKVYLETSKGFFFFFFFFFFLNQKKKKKKTNTFFLFQKKIKL